jgi:hypothetical protein
MSEHAWTLENVAAYVAGGLEPVERLRVQDHLAECPECARAAAAAQSADRMLMSLFADVRPGPTLEDRMIRTLRQPRPTVRRLAVPLSIKVVLAAAAVVMIAVVGATMSLIIDGNAFASLGFTEEATSSSLAANHLKQIGISRDRFFTNADGAPRQSAFARLQATDTTRGDDHDSTLGGVIGGIGGKKGVTTFDVDLGKESTTYWHVTPERLADDLRTEGLAKWREGPALTNGEMYGMHPPAAGTPALSPAPSAGPTSGGPGGRGPARGFGPGGGGQNGREAGKDAPVNAPARIPDPQEASRFSPQYRAPNTPPGAKAGDGILLGDSRATDLYFQPGDTFKLGVNLTRPPAGRGEGKQGYKVESERIVDNKDTRDLGDKQQKLGKTEPAGEKKPGATEPAAQQPAQPPAPEAKRHIIRSGEIDFEVDSFDNAVDAIQKLVTASKGGFVATINSDKQANGKIRGDLMVRIPPEQLDKFVLDLRQVLGKMGELKGQRIGSQDVSKTYMDLESHLKGARAMEERFLKIIREGKGEIKDLIAAENALGVWRTKIEEYEGELRYYTNLISLSSLKIVLTEKDIRVAAAVREREEVQAGVEVDDTEKAMREVLKAVDDAKGRVTRSEMKQHPGNQFEAALEFEVTPDKALGIRTRLAQVGNVVSLEIRRVQTAEGGGTLPKDGRLDRGPTRFQVSLYNLADIMPRETVTARVAADDMTKAYRALREAVDKAKGQVRSADFNEQDRQRVTAQLHFDVMRADEGALQAALSAAGEVLSRQVARLPEKGRVTDAKIRFDITLVSLDAIAARETVTLKLGVVDVAAAHRAVSDAVRKASAHIVNTSVNEQDHQRATAQLDFDVRRTDENAVLAAISTAGEVLSRQVVRAAESQNVTDKKVVYQIEFVPASGIAPRELVSISGETTDVGGVVATLTAQAKELKGRVVEGPKQAHEINGRVTANVVYDVPLESAAAFGEKVRNSMKVRSSTALPNPQAPDGKLAIARFSVTLSTDLLVPQDEGLIAHIRSGLSFSLRGLTLSVQVLIVGLLFVLPWVIVLLAVLWLIRRVWRPRAMPQAAAATPPVAG